MPIESFYRGYKKLDLGSGELIASLEVPLPKRGDDLRLYKMSRRRALDIASFTAAVLMRRSGDTSRARASRTAEWSHRRAPAARRSVPRRPAVHRRHHAARWRDRRRRDHSLDRRAWQRDLSPAARRNVLVKFFHDGPGRRRRRSSLRSSPESGWALARLGASGGMTP